MQSIIKIVYIILRLILGPNYGYHGGEFDNTSVVMFEAESGIQSAAVVFVHTCTN